MSENIKNSDIAMDLAKLVTYLSVCCVGLYLYGISFKLFSLSSWPSIHVFGASIVCLILVSLIENNILKRSR